MLRALKPVFEAVFEVFSVVTGVSSRPKCITRRRHAQVCQKLLPGRKNHCLARVSGKNHYNPGRRKATILAFSL
jgi:hypothetical protein